jgi:hypothetical protein
MVHIGVLPVVMDCGVVVVVKLKSELSGHALALCLLLERAVCIAPGWLSSGREE